MKIIRQLDYQDCGISCLEYIIEYYHGYVPRNKLREDTFTTEHGTTAYHLVETLKKYQFDAYGVKTDWKNISDLVLPAIVHLILKNGMHHFAVLCKVKKNEVLLMDPAYGKRRLSKEEFISIWDGVALLSVPLCKIPKIPKSKSIWHILWKYMEQEKKLIFPILFFSILVSILSILNSLYLKVGMENIGVLEKEKFHVLILCFGCFLFLKIILNYGKNHFKIYLNRNMEVNYMFDFLSHLFRLPVLKLQTYHEGEIVTRVEEAKEIKELFESICITFLLESILGVLSIFVLWWMNYKLSVVIILGMILYLLIAIISSKTFYFLVLESMENERKWNEHLLESIKLFDTMKHLNQTQNRIDVLEENLCETIQKRSGYQKKAMKIEFIRQNYLEILFFFLVTYAMILMKEGHLSLLDFITFQGLYMYFVTPFKELADIGPKFYYLKGILQKISETMDIPEEKVENTTSFLQDIQIEVKNVTYSYNQIDFVLDKVSFTIKAHEHIFLDGPSGCGKSTLCKILHKEIDNYQGEIIFSNKNIKDYSLSVIRNSVIYLSQNEHLMGGTIKENILFGKEENRRFDEVCFICEIENIVANRPLRYNTYINNNSLSGGEAQRVMLARALLKEGSIYLLDECLSEVEEELEKRIIAKMRNFLKEKTLIYVSHRNRKEDFERSVVLKNAQYPK